MRAALAALLLAGLLALTAAVPAAAGEPQAADAQDVNPRYLLVDAKGRMIGNEDFPGRFQLIAFGYTFCPDICPTTLAAMTQVLRDLGDKAPRLQPIFITVDPERDSKEVMGRYTAYFDARIIGLTGSPELVRAAADHYKVTYRKYLAPGAAPDSYSVDHSAGMYLLGPDGAFVAKFVHDAAPQEIAARIADLMAESGKPRPAAPR
ncbi:MAG: SCO family protein [Rhodocyclaceae bacterium]|nr:SCO family protein [Rhodocyclaceae bacterium]